MGTLLNKKKNLGKLDSLSTKITQSPVEQKLYKPISEFSWKDASPKELRKEAIAHYGIRFAL